MQVIEGIATSRAGPIGFFPVWVRQRNSPWQLGDRPEFPYELHDRGVRVIGRGLWYISAAHTKKDVDDAIAAAADVLKEL